MGGTSKNRGRHQPPNKQQKSLQQSIFKKMLGEIFLQHDDLEQYTRKFNLKIPESLKKKKDDEPEDIVFDLAKLMEIDLTYEDIRSHRFNKGRKSPRPIIVRFNNYYSKEQMYRGRSKLPKKSGLKVLGVDPKTFTSTRTQLLIKLAYSRKSAIVDREIGSSGHATETFLSSLIPLMM